MWVLLVISKKSRYLYSMNIDEQYLKTIICGSVRCIVKEELEKCCLNAMAMPLSDYKWRIENLIPQLVENWCLVSYCRLSGKNIRNKNHWQSELYAIIKAMASYRTARGNKAEVREKALYSIFSMLEIDRDEQAVNLLIYKKFYDENLPTEGEIYNAVIHDFISSIREIVNVILSQSPAEVLNYVKGLS